MLKRLNTFFKDSNIQFPNQQQQGFQKNLSCITTAFNLQETVYHQIERNSSVYSGFLDQKAAFDSVSHDGLFFKLGKLGVIGKPLRLLQSAYKGLRCVIRVNGATSTSLDVKRSVRQGGVLSTLYYLIYIDELLQNLENSELGCCVGTTSGGNPSFADDIAVLALSPLNLQRQIDIVYAYCQQWRIELNVSKSNIVVFTKKRRVPQVAILYGDKLIDQVNEAQHLGITQTSNLRCTTRITERCQKARNAFFAMAAQGVSIHGLNPLVSVNLYKKIIVPIALYGCQLWNYHTINDINCVNKLQHFVVKKIQGFGTRTRSDMAESMLGLNKLSTRIDIAKLMFLHKLLTLDAGSLSRNILIRRYLMYVSKERVEMYGFIPDMCKILCKYRLHTFINDALVNPASIPSKAQWKAKVNALVTSAANEQWTNRVVTDDDFCIFRAIHPTNCEAIVYKVCDTSEYSHTMHTVAKIWCRSSVLQTENCQHCKVQTVDKLIHIMAECPITYTERRRFILDISDYLQTEFVDDLLSLEPLEFALKILGSPIGKSLETAEMTQFLKRSFVYITQCTLLL